ncbi:PEP-CTERM sorting domain-containing protein [Rhodoferax lacus]|uniref:PEP-CTERM sorting domain-containing protein n=1 Tax=Rhodoferax lacus TaxID=2184758 RepID=A0A3E1R6C4_9BURK|nr:lamin tail domain-containing protein [Rhodoferax lacus]RFO94847.1 PEP-CTERM sorting domain-containing protein [Rhodoferax lacus]
MKSTKLALACVAASMLALLATPAQAAITITEVAPWGSASGYAADWFELTNTGSSSVSITGWKMDDNSNSYSTAVALNGISSIAAGQSVIFMETTTPSTTITNFLNSWFGSSVPASLLVGSYSGSGVGLSAGGDAVNIFDGSGALMANVSFGAATTGTSFDNAAGLTGGITRLSARGSNGAFTSAGGEIGSVGAVPEPESLALMLAGMAIVGAVARKRQR